MASPTVTAREEEQRTGLKEREAPQSAEKRPAVREASEPRADAKDGKKGFHPSRKQLLIAAVIALVLVTVGLLWWLHARNFVSTDDAYTTAHLHEISSRVAGTVMEVRVDDNQRVKAGQVLVELDPRDYAVALQTAQAGLAQAQAQAVRQQAAIAQARAQGAAADAQIGQARAQMEQTAAQLEKARLDYERVAGLYTTDLKAVSKADVDAATEELDTARGAMESARAALSAATSQAQAAQANLRAAQADAAVAAANISAAESKARDAQLQLSYCEVVSPVAGKVSKKTVETGQRLQPGEALMAIVPDDVWVLANLKETELERVEIGERVDVTIDALPDYKFFGTVNSLQEGSGATFTLLPPDNATGNFTKIVQRVPVKVVFDPESVRDFLDKIVPGLSVEATIDLVSPNHGKARERKRR